MDQQLTISSFLPLPDPIRSLWVAANKIVFEGNSAHANPMELGFAARTFYYTELFNLEMVNGGLSQFFSNSSGDRSHETLNSLLEIGATFSAASLQKGLQAFPGGIAPADRKTRCEMLFSFEERSSLLQEITDEYYRKVVRDTKSSIESFSNLQLAHLRSHAADRIWAI